MWWLTHICGEELRLSRRIACEDLCRLRRKTLKLEREGGDDLYANKIVAVRLRSFPICPAISNLNLYNRSQPQIYKSITATKFRP